MALASEVIESPRVPRIGPYSQAVRVGDLVYTAGQPGTCFVANPNAFPVLNALFAEFFPDAPPVRSTPIVQLPKGLLFSIDAIAVAERR